MEDYDIEEVLNQQIVLINFKKEQKIKHRTKLIKIGLIMMIFLILSLLLFSWFKYSMKANAPLNDLLSIEIDNENQVGGVIQDSLSQQSKGVTKKELQKLQYLTNLKPQMQPIEISYQNKISETKVVPIQIKLVSNNEINCTIHQTGNGETLVINNTKLVNFSLNSTSIRKIIFINNPLLINFVNSNLPNVQSITIEQTNFEIFQNNTLYKLESIQFINSQVLFKNFGISNYKIKNLTLINTNITNLQFSYFQSLQYLTMKQNKILSLMLGKSQLKYLNLQLQSLTQLTIRQNKLQTFQNLKAPKMKVFEIINTELSSFKNIHLQSLYILNLTNNKIQEFSNNVFPSLSILLIEENSLMSIQINNYLRLAVITLNTQSLQELKMIQLISINTVIIFAPELKSLFLKNVKSFSLNQIQTFSRLNKLFLYGTFINKYKEQYVFSDLKTIQIENCKGIDVFDLQIPKLTELILNDLNITKLNISQYIEASVSFRLPLLEQFIAFNNVNLNSSLLLSSFSKSQHLKKVSLNLTNLNQIDWNLSSIQQLYIGQGLISSINLNKLTKLKNLTILNNMVQQINLQNKNFQYLKIDVTYHFFDLLTMQNTNVVDFSNISCPNLEEMNLINTNFTQNEPIKYGLQNLKIFSIEKSNIRFFNTTKFPYLINFYYSDCQYIDVISISQEATSRNNLRKQQI